LDNFHRSGFFLFGNPIAHSLSPTLHNTGFKALSLPHQYELLETADVGEEIKAAINSAEFGGASVTIPFKLDVIPLLDKLSPAAQVLGAVNTIVPKIEADGKRVFYGDNTDWSAIRRLIEQRLGGTSGNPVALVIGAGGTARAALYALQQLGVKKIYLHNRTSSKARSLVEALPGMPIEVIESLEGPEMRGALPTVIISTVPTSATTRESGKTGLVYLGESLFSAGGGVAVDVAYEPAETPLLELAKEKGWSTVSGVEVLIEQGEEQFERWTGRRPPSREIAKNVWGKYEKR